MRGVLGSALVDIEEESGVERMEEEEEEEEDVMKEEEEEEEERREEEIVVLETELGFCSGVVPRMSFV